MAQQTPKAPPSHKVAVPPTKFGAPSLENRSKRAMMPVKGVRSPGGREQATPVQRRTPVDDRLPQLAPSAPGRVRPATIQRMVVNTGSMASNAIATYRNRNDGTVIHVSRAGTLQSGRFTYVGDSGIGKITLTDPLGNTSTLAQFHEGSLDYTSKKIPKSEYTAFAFSGTEISTLAIKTMDAKPYGHALGNILVFHLAEYALSNNVAHVVALNVVMNANMFYQRLGFHPYRTKSAILTKQGWVDGQNQKTWYDKYNLAQNTAFGTATTEMARNRIMENLQRVRENLAENHMVVSAATLRTNAVAAWRTQWQAI